MTDMASERAVSVADGLARPASDRAPSLADRLSRPATVVVFVPGGVPRAARPIGLWLGIPVGILAVVAGVCAAILIAPGVLIGGVDIGWRTPGAATEMVASALADTAVTVHTPTRDVTLTAEQLGMSVDATAIAALAYSDHPLWNVGAWNPGNLPIAVDVDRDVAEAALAAAAPVTFSQPVNAQLTFDSKLAKFTTTASKSGMGVDFAALGSVVSEALGSGSRAVTFDAAPHPLEPAVTAEGLRAQATQFNDLIDTAGFYVGDNEVLSVDPAMAASWIRASKSDGRLQVDTAAAMNDVWRLVADLPRIVNHPATQEVIVTNSAGDHLRTVQDGADGQSLGSTSGIAAAFVASFAAGDGKFELGVTGIPYTTALDYRSIEVNETTGEAILYENGKVVDTYLIAIGKPSTPTAEGHFTVYAQVLSQNMGCSDGYDYCTPDVPWISYFNGDDALHGTYWHDNFGPGAMMSHGCVNMRIADAERVYHFAQIGTEVWVHS